MTGPSYRAILRVESATASEEIKRRFSTTVFLPSTEKVDIMGGAVFAASKRSTRSGMFSAEGGVDGKICVCETLGDEELKEALLYAKKEKALALIVTEKPNRTVDVPTILISRDQLRSIKDELKGALISITYTSGSYEIHPVTFVLQSFGEGKETVEWDGKIHVSANATDHHDLHYGFVTKARLFRNQQGDIVEFVDNDEMAGRICLVEECGSDRHFVQVVRLAAQYGAIVLFTTHEKPPLRNLPLPVVVVKKKHVYQMGKLGAMVRFKYKSEAQGEVSKPEPQATLPAPKSYASALQDGTSKSATKNPPRLQTSSEKKSSWSWGIIGEAVTSVGRTFRIIYDPQSKKKFKAIVANGTSWSKDVQLYHEAMELLAWVDSVEDSQNRQAELEMLNEAIGEVVNDMRVGDVMIVFFCSKLRHLLSPEASLQLMQNAVKLIKEIKIDESHPISSSLDLDTTDLNRYVADMVKYLSNQPLNKGSMKSFVLNALWIQVHHCQSVKTDRWDDLRAIATHTLFKDERETLLSFMPLSQFNTLSIGMATSLQDICTIFSGEDKVSVLSAAIPGLLRLYKSDSTSTKDVTAITLLDRFEMENAGFDISRAETNFINAIVQNIERKPAQAFSDFGCVYNCIRIDSKLYDVATESMMKSISSSLKGWRDIPSPGSVSELLQMDIGRHLVSDRRGFNALKSYLKDRLFQRYLGQERYPGQDKEKLVLLKVIYSSFYTCGSCTEEEAATVTLDAIRAFVDVSRDHYKLCLTAMDISQHFQDIFHDGDNSSLTSQIGEIFVRKTGICSTIRASPTMLCNVTSRLQNRPEGRLSHFLYRELVRGLKDECRSIGSAIFFFHGSVWKGDISKSLDARNIVYEIIVNSFDIWNPSSIIDLLKLEASLLKTIHDVLLSIAADENCDELHRKKSSACLQCLCSVAGKWLEKFEKEKCNVTELQRAKCCLTDDKQEVLSTILSSRFPSPSDIDEKVFEMENLIGKIRSSLNFSVTKDDDIFTISINDLATHYRIKIDTPLSHLISKYLSGSDPIVDLVSIRRESKHLFDFVNTNRRELQAAAHFHFFRSALFQNEVGVWAEICFDDFFSKVSASLRHLEVLLSPAATFSSVSAAASVLVRDRVDFDGEMAVIMSFHVVDDERTKAGLKDVMTLASLAEQFGNFVVTCKTFKFAFAECDDCFIELEDICNQMNCNEGCDWNIEQCIQTGKRLAEILLPGWSADLSERLQYYKPLIDFFAELRHCSSVLDLAREKSWFGKKGLSTFYQEFENVTNVLNQKQSYEMEVLNRLEPTMQCISAVGGNLQCERVATLLEILNANDYFSHQNISAMRMIQENICKIQDWLSEGMDEIAATHSKFALILSSGRIVISSEGVDSVDEATTPKRALSLYFSRTDASEVIMDESEVRELVQHLGFTTHESDESRINVEKFVRVYEQCGQVMASQQMMADVGFGGDKATKRLEYTLNEDSEDLAQRWVDETDNMIEECKNWLGQIRSKNRHSLLFWKDELRLMFVCMCGIRIKSGDGGSVEWQLLMSILSQMPLKPDCSNLIEGFVSQASFGESWLEDVSIFVSECGNQDHLTSSLGGSNVVIHKVDCLNNTVFAAQLQLMHHIYKKRCPSSFEYLDASCIKSSYHVAMFLERVRAFPEHIFVIAYVERLAASEQELVATFIAQHARSADTIHLHCIQSKDTVLYASPGVSISSWNNSSLNECCPSQWLQDCVALKGHVCGITIVFSDTPGSGKTKFIRGELEKANANGAQVASLYIHEDFTLTKAVEQLRNKFGEGGSEAKSIHFGLSCDAEPSVDFMLSVNHFFNSLLLFGNVYDPITGDSFYGSSHKWNVFVEMNARLADEETAQSWLSEHVPILSHCNLRIMQPPSDVFIDEKARRVATYLRAYDNGTIDRKFNSTPANKTIFFVLDKSGSMCITDIGGRSRFQVASESMLSVFNSHIRVMDSVGVVLFDHQVSEVVPFQRIENDQDLITIRRDIANLTIGPDGGTSMYSALQRVLQSVSNSTRGQDEDVWVVCLTDGQSADNPCLIREQLRNSPANLHVILIGVGLEHSYHQAMRDLCNKYHAVNQPNNKGIFLPTALDINDIEGAFDEVASRIPVSQTFELDGAMSDEQCRDWLDRYRPHFVSPANKLLYSFWISFIYRRVSVFDASEDFNYNETHDSLGSSLMEVMLLESEQMLMRDQTDRSWSQSKHTQLIYDFSQPDSPKFRLICTSPDDLDPIQRERFERLDLPGFAIPNTMELRRRETLDRYLSQALSIPLTEDENGNQYLQCVNDHKFVLTLDFTLKLLNIHEHVSCGAPCVMEGETGVSKTALTKMYSILVNSQQMQIASVSTMDTLESTLQELMTLFPGVVVDNEECMMDRILTFLEISSQHTSTDVYRAVTVICGRISVASSKRNALFLDMPSFVVPDDGGIDVLAQTKEMLTWFSQSDLEQLFFDINIHASMTAEEINEKLSEAKRVARKVAGSDTKVVVFLDEINTASVLGLIKEIIVDRSLNGEPLEENIVIVAACNPVRKSSLSQVTANRVSDLGREWVSGHYQVRQLPPSLSTICWDYGALKREQEKEFIQQRILMMDQNLPISLTSRMTEILSSSHEFIRELARDHIVKCSSSASMDESEAFLRARSVVSLRDIQRVFHLTDYFLNHFALEGSNSDNVTHPFRRAMLVSVAIVYYLRLDAAARNIFVQKVNNLPTEQDEECGLLDALGSAIDKVVEETEIPKGISLTLGLKENIFVTLVCTLSRVPLMIIGPPGCSKTLAVSIVNDNANGEESPSQFYRDLARIQPFHYQCSKTSTSNEVASLFSRANQRQMTVDRAKQQCLVFMDEAGLPEEERESLKVLHYLLEGHMSSSPNVAFVCITNHILDAAKSNRCACLLRPEPDMEELSCISKGVLCQKMQEDSNSVELVCFREKVLEMKEFSDRMCSCYMDLMKDTDRFSFFVDFFGLRDFIHFLKYLRRAAPPVKESILHITEEVFVNALERNFNGIDKEKFVNMCAFFVAKGLSSCDQIRPVLEKYIRDPMEVIHNALSEQPTHDVSRYNLPRYKMIIDHTNDDSITRLLQISGVLNSSHAFYKLSGIDEGAEIEKLNLVSRVKFAAQYGKKTVVLSQVEGVSECFYDLFNQHFKEFRKEDGEVTYFANIAIGGVSRPCPVSPSFQCIVHVQSAELAALPAPFLNRFEKFQLDVDDILRYKLKQLPPGLSDILSQSLQDSQDFVESIGDMSVWSRSAADTLKSIYISLIRPEVCSDNIETIARGESIAFDVLSFIINNFEVGVTVEDIQSCIDSARVEYRGLKEGVELERVIACINMGKAALPFEDVLNDCLRTPLSRVLKQIILSSITRCAVIRLLHLVRPDALYLRRRAVPCEMLRIYFGEQEHFSLKRLIGKLCESRNAASQLHIVYARSDSSSHSLPSWSNIDIDGIDPSILHRVRSLVHDDPSTVEIHHLDLMNCESEIRTTFDSWVSKGNVTTFVMVVDMKMQSANIVNFIRSYVEQATLSSDKNFILLLHFPLSCDQSIYPALFLGNWSCIFLDDIGDADGNTVDFNNVLQSACSLTGQKLNADTLLAALKPKALQYVASQVPFYSCSKQPDSINQVMTLTARMDCIEKILASNVGQATLETILCRKFIVMWTDDRIREVVHRSAHALASGNSKLSFSSALTSTLQSSFNKFLAKSVLEINVWSNLDVLDPSSADAETDKIFSLVLNRLSLPGVPLEELILLRDISHPLQPLPMEVEKEAIAVFPFFFQISSLIEMAIDKANFDFLDQSSLGQNDDFGPLFVERVDALLCEMADGTEMAGAVRDIVTYVAGSERLFSRYLQHILAWRYGCRNLEQVEKWISQKLDVASMLDESLHCNILYLHILCRKNVGSILRIASWDSECIAKELLQNGVQFEGISFVTTVSGHFLRLLSENFETKKWSDSFSVFLQSLSALMEGCVIEDEDLLSNLRLLILVNVLISGDVEETAILRIVQSITEAGDTPKDMATASGCLDLLKDSKDETTLAKLKDAKDQVMRIFFSPWWLKVISDKICNDDAFFLVSAIRHQYDYITGQMAVVHLRNVLTSRGNRIQPALPTSTYPPSIVLLLSSELNATHNESFSESGDRVGMPHFVPHWLFAEGVSTTPSTDCAIDEVGWYLRNYRNNFHDCPLARIIFAIIFGELLEKAKSINSNELLIMFQASIQEQKEVNQATNARLLRFSGQASLQGPVSIKGCYVRALETDAILLTFVCKVAEELSILSRSYALEGVNAVCAVRILDGVMPQFRWSDFFFKMIMSLKGDGHLANLLSEGGPLHNFEWCQQWMQGLSSHQQDVQIRLERSETALRESERDEENKARHFRRCPHCNEMFGVDQENCGVFYCGRDAHGANGPAIGGRAVQGGYGCGGQFRLGEALPYVRDETLLEPLREELRENRILFEASNRGAELWTRAESLEIPHVSFHVRNEEGSSMFSKIFSVSLVDHLPQSNERDNIGRLADILGQLPKLEHVSCLPDLIEFYIFIHKTFRHVVTREESFNMKLRDVMDERLLRARFGAVHASHLHSLWLRVVEKVNLFVSANESSVTFECENVEVPFSDLSDVSLIQVLSEAEHPSHGNDTLFLVINDLLMRYNNFIVSVSAFRNTRSVNDQPEEIHPRSLVRGSKSSIAVKAVTEDVATTIANLVESYWEGRSFSLEGLLGAIQQEFDIIGSLQTVMPPLSFLREGFMFRDCFVSNDEMEESGQCFFSPNKQLYFAQCEDWMLYEDVRDKAVKKWSDGKNGSCSIRHKMIVTFQHFSHGEWSSLLEGMRNTLDGLDFSNAQKFGEATKLLGIDSLQAVGFPAMDGAGSVFVNTLSKDDIFEFIDVCGEQLAAEAYTYNRLPSRLSEPISADLRESLEDNIHQLLQTKSNSDVHNEIHAFCKDVLSFYEPHIVTVSEQSNEPVVAYLRRNNAWDNTDSICAALPSNLGIRNYIDIRKVFHQLKLRLRQAEDGENKSDSEVSPYVDTPDSSAWKWVARPSRNTGAEEEIRQGIFDKLWFEEAIRPRCVDDASNTIEEARQPTSGGNEDAAPLDNGGVEDEDEVIPDLGGGDEDGQEESEQVEEVKATEGEDGQEESEPAEEVKEAEEEEAEIARDSNEADNVEEDDSAANAALSAHHLAAENQTVSSVVPEAREVPVKVKGKQRQMTAVAALTFAMIFTALVYALYRYLAFVLTHHGAAEAEINETDECNDDVTAELTAGESNEYIG